METIPWYKSTTLRALIIAALAQVVVFFGLSDTVTSDQIAANVDKVLDVISLLATAWVAHARINRANPPITEKSAAKAEATQVQLKQGGYSTVLVLVGIFVAASVGVGLVGCVGTTAAYKAADTLEDRAYVVTEHYAAIVKQAADLKEQGVLTGSTLVRVQEAETVAHPIVLSLGPLVKTFKTAQSAESEVALQKALDDAVMALANLVRLVKAASTGGA